MEPNPKGHKEESQENPKRILKEFQKKSSGIFRLDGDDKQPLQGYLSSECPKGISASPERAEPRLAWLEPNCSGQKMGEQREV